MKGKTKKNTFASEKEVSLPELVPSGIERVLSLNPAISFFWEVSYRVFAFVFVVTGSMLTEGGGGFM